MPLSLATRRFTEVTTLHGIRDLISGESKTIRVIWAFVIFCATGLLVYEIVVIFNTFMKEPIATNIQLQKMTRHKLAGIITPYICMSDWMNSSQTLYSPEQLWALDAFSNQNTGSVLNGKTFFNETLRSGALKWIEHYQSAFLNGATLEDYYEPIMKRFSFLPHENDPRFMRYIIIIDAVCFPIALEPATDVVGVPVYRGVINFHPEDTVLDLKQYSHSKKQEVTIIFYHGISMRYVSEIDRVIVNFTVDSDASQMNLRMQFRQMKHLSRRETECQEYPAEESKSKLPVNYARQICMQTCMDNKVYVPKYNCSFRKPRMKAQLNLVFANYNRDLPLCTAEKFFMTRSYTAADMKNVMHCQDSCEGLESFCTEWDVQMERQRWVAPRTCDAKGCLNLAIVAQPTLEVSEEILLMTFDTLLSNLGGQAGLWFGGSVLSIVQLLFFCVLYGTGKCSCGRRRKSLKVPLNHTTTAAPTSSEAAVINVPLTLSLNINGERGGVPYADSEDFKIKDTPRTPPQLERACYDIVQM